MIAHARGSGHVDIEKASEPVRSRTASSFSAPRLVQRFPAKHGCTRVLVQAVSLLTEKKTTVLASMHSFHALSADICSFSPK
eukprot:3892952-Rhodomonas_salina.1